MHRRNMGFLGVELARLAREPVPHSS
jgi:hypothetical protein